jgi:hypothetical protein
MLGVLRGLLPGAAFAQTWPTLISLWQFDETSPAGGVFTDFGPANVPMNIVGTWADLSTDSMIQGIGGTSAYTGGSGYATIAANDPDHDLAELTISFYYQRNSAAAKHVLLAASDALSTGVGDFSIEVLPNGRLRAFHVGQDAQLRFFESTNGITGTNLEVGSAHRIDLTLGSLGARIYLDGVPLTHAFIPANRNGWNNTRIKHLGVWTDGVLDGADGAFDGFRIWDRQLTAEQVATLEPAQSVSLPGGPQPAQELSVPSLAEWLRSDESDPTPTKFVAKQDRGNGSGSSPGHAQELQAALNNASPGQTFLAVCKTPGTIEFWDYPNGISFPSGSPGNPITLQARQGDGVVISAAESFAGARTPNSGYWTQSGLSQADIDAGIWKSTQSFGSATTSVLGVWIEFDHPHYLVPYGSMANLRAPYNSTNRNPPISASGSGLHLDNGTLYIRWIRPHPSKNSGGNKWQSHLWPGHPEAISAGQIAYPVGLNPNDYIIHVYRANQTAKAFNMSAGVSGGFVKIGSGINSLGYQSCIQGHDIAMRRGTHIAWRFWMVNGQTANPQQNYDIQRARFAQGSQRHLSRDDFKFFDASGGKTGWPEGSYRGAFIGTSGAADSIRNVNFKDCTIADYHELAVARLFAWRFRNCTIFNILDDGFQGNPAGRQMEIGYCFFSNSAIGGNDGSGTAATADLGQIFVHHNVWDQRIQKCSSWGNDTFPPFMWQNHSASGNQPRKNYNNTVFWAPDNEDAQSFGFQHNSNNDNTATGTQRAHEVFNNLFIRQDVQRYIPTNVGSPSPSSRSDWAGSHVSCDPSASNEFWDYNLYYRDVPDVLGSFTDNFLFKWRAGKNNNEQNPTSLAAFKASALFTLSKSSGSLRGAYLPGFENSGTEAKPTLPSLDNFPADRHKYRPSATNAVTTATTSSLSGANWWSTPPTWGATYFPWNDGEKMLAPSGWKGALDPNGSTLPVGVENP